MNVSITFAKLSSVKGVTNSIREQIKHDTTGHIDVG